MPETPELKAWSVRTITALAKTASRDINSPELAAMSAILLTCNLVQSHPEYAALLCKMSSAYTIHNPFVDYLVEASPIPDGVV